MPTIEAAPPAEVTAAARHDTLTAMRRDAFAKTRREDLYRWSAATIQKRLHVSPTVAEALADRTTKWRIPDIAAACGYDALTPKQWRNRFLRHQRNGTDWTLDNNALPPPDGQEGRDPVWLAGPMFFWLMQTRRVDCEHLAPTHRGQPKRRPPAAAASAD